MTPSVFPSSLRKFICCALSYVLMASFLGLRPARAVEPSVRPTGAPAPAAVTPQALPKRAGELLVRFHPDMTQQSKNTALSARGARLKSKLRGVSGVERVEVQGGQDLESTAASLRALPGVEMVEPNFLINHSQTAPDDPRFAEQWALKNTGQAGGGVGSDVRAIPAWAETSGSTATVVAVLDSGVDFSHADLKNNRWRNPSETPRNGVDDDHNGMVDDVYGWNWVYNSEDVGDEQGHGTAVAGIIAAEGNNRVGVSGVMWHASLMSLKVLDSTGTGDVASAVEAIDYAGAHGAAVINCSWGTAAESQLLKEALERAGRNGVVVIASAGNAGRSVDESPYYPASYNLPNLIAVAATDGFDNLASFSGWGAARVALAAPGVDVLTTQLGGNYQYVSGTSAAAPFVSGIAGLVKTLRPNLPASGVRDAVVGGARKVETLFGKVTSAGVADASGALAALHGNPYAGNSNGNSNGNGNGNGTGTGTSNGNGNGNGQGNKQSYVPPALRHDNDHGRAKGHGGLLAEAPPRVKGAPGENLPDLNASRKVRTSPPTQSPAGTIHADLRCPDCDPSGDGGAGGTDPYFGTSRTQSRNEVGTPGESTKSQNFNWNLPILSLPGRAGHDLSLALYYNSLVWVRQGTAIQYNPDHGTPAPGFQLGMPRLQARYYDDDDAINSYIMITPSGGRVQLKQTLTPGTYESTDGSYTQLVEGTPPVVRTSDGMQYEFGVFARGEWRCTQMKDHNGNYISATYNGSNGHLLTVTDTLGRVIDFNYNADGTLASISQMRAGVPYYYAWFFYASTEMWPNFGVPTVLGPTGGADQTVLSYVALTDNESYHFDYNKYGQVYQIRHKAPDGHELSHTRYNLTDADLTGWLADCPRYSARYEYAQDWNSGQEAVTTYSYTTGATWKKPETQADESGGLTEWVTPDGLVMYRQYSHTTGWDAGLPRLDEVWARLNLTSSFTKKKWTSTDWTQDAGPAGVPLNPRVTEVNTYDSDANRSRTTYEYNQGYSLATHVRDYTGADGQTFLRMTATNYNLDPVYLNRRIIGLVFRSEVYDAGGLRARTDNYYDWDGGGDMFTDTPAPATQHDRTNYGPSFLAGRGNLSDVIRYDVNDPTNQNGTSQETKYRVNTTGSVVMVRDHGWHSTYFDYADNFSDNNNSRNTFAYPTKETNPDGYFSTTQYNYDFGAATLSHRPAAGAGAAVTYVDVALQYDSRGRVTQSTNLTNNAYQKWVYEPDGNFVHTYETIIGATQNDEFHSWQVFDGAGRVRASASDHPNSVGGYSGRHFVYDVMGRLSQQSNPTEITGGWVPANWSLAGDDSAWVYTTQAYDWKDRPTQLTNPDSTTRVLGYGGCGCAGGEVTTGQDEHGRQRRFIKDALGRLAKVEELNWNGTVYSTTQYAYTALDQIKEINQQGQLRTFDYDGHGRLWHKTTPEQGTTTYTYNGDDTLDTVTDARGATATFGYNGRHLVTSINYGVPSGVAATPNVTLDYDAAGHRTSMVEKNSSNSVVGSTTYHYNALAQMDWEERSFPSDGNYAAAGAYRLSYIYNPGGELTSITLPTQLGSPLVGYTYDKAGRLSAVTGANYAGVSTYASSITYRAFGAVKAMSFASGRTLSTSYDDRMRLTKWDVSGVLGYNYSYNHFDEKTGRVTYAQSIYDSSLDRSYEYDHVGRLAISHAGAEARAHAINGQWGVWDGDYSQGFDYDVWGNVTHRYGWGGEVLGGTPPNLQTPPSSTDRYYAYATDGNGVVSNRRTGDGFTYDAAGNLTFDGGQHFTYDAGGRQVSSDYTGLQQAYDGDGLRVRRTQSGSLPTLFLRSSVLGGQVVAELGWGGVSWQWVRGYVYAGSKLLALQQGGVFFVHEDPVTKSKRVTNTSGVVQSAVESDPLGAETTRSSNSAFQPRKFTTYERDANGTDEAMFRRYNRWHARFDQPDPYDGSYDLQNPQSLNRYAYVNGDPVNFVDPTGLDAYCFDVYEVSTPIDVRTGRVVGASSYKYLYSYCLLSNGNYVRQLRNPRDRNPLGGRVPFVRSVRPVGIESLSERFKKEYNKCLEERQKERDNMGSQMFVEAAQGAGIDAAHWGGFAGMALGGRIGVRYGQAGGLPGAVMGGLMGSFAGGLIGAGSAFLLGTGKSWVSSALSLPEKKAQHKAQDDAACKKEAFAVVGQAVLVQ